MGSEIGNPILQPPSMSRGDLVITYWVKNSGALSGSDITLLSLTLRQDGLPKHLEFRFGSELGDEDSVLAMLNSNTLSGALVRLTQLADVR